jgi:hypothetical protein
MWCKQCRQDVPGISSAKHGHMSCARCGATLSPHDNGPSSSADQIPAAERVDLNVPRSPLTPYPSFEDWEVEQTVRNLQARVGRGKRTERPARGARPTAERLEGRRLQGAHPPSSAPHLPTPPERNGFLARLVLTLGLAIFAVGAGLLGWSIAEQRADLWNLGVPVTVAGQATLLLGLVLQLERIWQNGRYTARKLEQVDSQLGHIHQTTKLLTMTHTSAAAAFYSHMADEADPQLLLADLKGQLDLLAVSISKHSA